MTLKDGINQFLESLEVERNRSLATIRAYRGYLNRFSIFAAERGVSNPTKISQDLVRQYRLALARVREEPLSKATQAYHLIALRSFLKYLAKRDIKTLAPEKIDLPKMPQRQVTFLEPEELTRLLEAPFLRNPKPETRNLIQTRNSKSEIICLRDKAILEMLFSTGMRVSELASLRRDQINLKRDEFTVRGKGSKLRVVFLSPRAKAALTTYLDKRNDASLALFVRHDRAASSVIARGRSHRSNLDRHGATRLAMTETLTPRSIQRIVEKYAKAAGISKPVHPHTLRHTTATDLLRSGANLKQVQAFLGHSSITTTQIYTHVTAEDLREVHKKYHGKSLK